jgi:hypothetical protein
VIWAAWTVAKSFVGGVSGRAWLIIGALVAFAAWSFYVLGVGYSWADAQWEAKALEAKIARLERELEVQKDADAAADQLRVELEAESQQQKEAIDHYLAELDRRAGKCLLGPDARRLQ